MLYGLLNLSFWGYVAATLILTQITIAGVTLYLHRNQSHRALDLHPIVSHFFRFWLWLTTGMVTGEWVAIHRKHHAATEVEGDPHSPQVFGLNKVLWHGAELYRGATKDKAMIEKYSHGTPNDWVERHIYAKYPATGIALMFFLDLLLFGVPGITVWAIQMFWIPFHAAGVINGIGHYFGYRNFECKDASTNLIPWAFWIGGEELHNNHHAFAASAKFSVKWWEFDIGWLYIKVLSFLGLAKVKKLPPKLAIAENRNVVDLETVKAVVANRLQVMSYYYKQVTKPILFQVKRSHKNHPERKLFSRASRLLKLHDDRLKPQAKRHLQSLLAHCESLRIVYSYRQSLQNIWLKTASSQKELVEALQAWCKQAEESGLDVLKQFAKQVKRFVPKTVML